MGEDVKRLVLGIDGVGSDKWMAGPCVDVFTECRVAPSNVEGETAVDVSLAAVDVLKRREVEPDE
jgi:hypothetical protein